MIRKTVSAMSSSALVAAGFIASGAAPAVAGAANMRGEARSQIALSRDQAVARAEAATGARAIDVSFAGGAEHGLFGIEMTRQDGSLVLVLVSDLDGAVHLLDMGDAGMDGPAAL